MADGGLADVADSRISIIFAGAKTIVTPRNYHSNQP